ncbi:MAG: ATP-dependent RNA helicase DbpA [Verrucomicrobia bacterium ADurb.Bin474]|nr:MAG: ATP-dependent RNA helicase DbpA [Verrucomicrobia bacterium ADurb.Bin474]
MSDFRTLGVSEELIQGLNELGIIEPSEIQLKGLPMLLDDTSDLVCRSETGTGKTVTFGIPLLHNIDPNLARIQGLILAPTRELAKQIAKQLFKFTKYYHKIFTEAVYGGEDIGKHVQSLKRTTHIVVATPGRLVDLMKLKAVDLSAVQYVVLDEADEMMSRGFGAELDAILSHTRQRRGTWLFSATLPDDIQRLITNFMSHKSRHLMLSGNEIMNRAITHYFKNCKIEEKFGIIEKFLRGRKDERGMIFCRSRAGAVNLAEHLNQAGLTCGVLQGDLSQKERERVMRMFKRGDTQFLVATDVAARGIDIENLAFVIHHQLPDQIEYYTHRSGRTARAGKTGVSLALISGGDRKRLETLQAKLKIDFRQA